MYTFGIASDVVVIGRDCEEGTPVEAQTYYVLATGDKGQRLRHFFEMVDTVKKDDPEEGLYFFVPLPEGEVEAKMNRLLERIKAHVAAGGKLNSIHWTPTYPVYGSDEYQDQEAQGLHVMWERAVEAGDPGLRGSDIYADAGMGHLRALAA